MAAVAAGMDVATDAEANPKGLATSPVRRVITASLMRLRSAPNSPPRLPGLKRPGLVLLHRGKANRQVMSAPICQRFCCVRCGQKPDNSGVFTPLLRL